MAELRIKLNSKGDNVEFSDTSKAILRDHLARSIIPDSDLFDQVFDKISALVDKEGMNVSGSDMCRVADLFKSNFEEIGNAEVNYDIESNEVSILKRQGTGRGISSENLKPSDMKNLTGDDLKKLKTESPSKYKRLTAEALELKKHSKSEVK